MPNPIPELSTLPNVAIEDRGYLPDAPGVYIAHIPGGEVLYIGKAASLFNRWKFHNHYAQLAAEGGVRIAWLEMRGENDITIRNLENRLIQHHEPALNIASMPYRGPRYDRDRMTQVRISASVREKLVRDSERLGLSQVQLIHEALRQFDASRWLAENGPACGVDRAA